MRIAVMGAGAVGGYFGGLLARAGNPVVLIARGPHLQAIRDHGLELRSHWRDFTVQVEATDDPTTIGPVELVLYTVKTYQNDSAIPGLMSLVGRESSVIALQNGVDSYEAIASAVGPDRVLPGAVYIEASVEAPGVVVQQGGVVRLVFGEITGPATPRCRRILRTLADAGIEAAASDDITKELWSKYLFVSVLAGVTGASRARLSSLLPHPPLRDLIMSAMREVEAVASARGVSLDPDIVPNTMDYLLGWAKDLKASLHTDLELGRPLELDALTGTVVRLGREVGVATPINDALYCLLLVHRDGSGETG